MTGITIINNWTGGGTLQTWKDGEWQIVYAKDSAGNCVTLSLNSSDAVRLAYAVSSQPGEQFDRMREYMHAVYELSYPEARADELRQIANEIECVSRCERCPADQPERGEYCGFVAADSLRKLAAALDAKAKADAEASAPAENAVFLARRNIYQQCAKIADDLRDQYPDVADNGGTRDGWEMACQAVAKATRERADAPAPAPEQGAAVSVEELADYIVDLGILMADDDCWDIARALLDKYSIRSAMMTEGSSRP